jgi:hypothetical protein
VSDTQKKKLTTNWSVTKYWAGLSVTTEMMNDYIRASFQVCKSTAQTTNKTNLINYFQKCYSSKLPDKGGKKPRHTIDGQHEAEDEQSAKNSQNGIFINFVTSM